MRALLITALGALVLAVAPAPASAICIACSCDVSADPITFLPFNPLLTPTVNAAGVVHVSCVGVAGAFVDQEVRMGPSARTGTFAREMEKTGGARLPYNLYLDAGRTQVWTETAPNTHIYNITLGLLAFSYNVDVFAKIEDAGTAQPGAYTDTITVTLIY